MCVTVYIYYVHINTHTCMYIFVKICYHYILNIFIDDHLYDYEYIHVNIFKVYAVCVVFYICIINIHSTHTHVM